MQPNPGRLPGGEPPQSVIVVSPHFDDAVFSCWSVLSRPGVVVVTVFTAGPPDDRITAWDADTGVTSAQRMAQRAQEDDAALALAGCRAEKLDLLQAAYGGGAVDPALLGVWLAGARSVYVPAGAGLETSHPEHVVVRDACLAVRPDARLYADNPYSGFRGDVTLPRGLCRSYDRAVVDLSPEQRARKAEAIRCYAGELPKLERIHGPLADPDVLLAEVFWAPADA